MSSTNRNIHTFRKPVTVLRYIPQEIKWHKAEHRALASRQPEWDKKVLLNNGVVKKGVLCLREDLLQSVEQLPTDYLLLRGLRSAAWIELFQRAHKLPFFLNLYKLESAIWVELVDDHYPHFGSKARDRFDIVPLTSGKSVAIHINARYWHSLFGTGMDTHYIENYLYLENLGQFDSAALYPELHEPFVFQPNKEVDFRQLLY